MSVCRIVSRSIIRQGARYFSQARPLASDANAEARVPKTARELISVDRVSETLFKSSFNPQRHGSTQAISYGGIPLSHCIMSAAATVPSNYFLYSCLGSYLGPTSILLPVQYTVEDLRTTKTFCTRKVEAWQILEGEKKRRTMLVILDFQVREDGIFEYSTSPMRSDYPRPSELLPIQEALQERVRQNDLSQETVDRYNSTFPLHNRYFDSKGCPSGLGWQNLYGMDKKKATTQDDLPITSKTNAMWFKSKVQLNSHAESAAALSFIADGALAFMPLTHTQRNIEDAGPTSSLELAFRVFSTDLDVNKWFLQEQHTAAARDGRTFSIGQIYDENFQLLANMSQMCILRAKRATA